MTQTVQGYKLLNIVPQPPAALQDATSTSANPELDFIQMMVAELQNQDPDKPMDPTTMVTQLSQMNAAMAVQREAYLTSADSQVSTAASMLGRTVAIKDPTTGASVDGKVSTVDYSGDAPQVVVNGQPYPLNAVNSVDQ
ncbi:MAG TPA: flagellar hook capping FlgD N-terminal domain-containing protein [Oscillatoriaceae cyanobacterium]